MLCQSEGLKVTIVLMCIGLELLILYVAYFNTVEPPTLRRMEDGTIEAVLMCIGPGLLILYFAYFDRATHAEKDSRWHNRSNPSMVEKALEEALHNKVVCTVAKSRQFPNISVYPLR